MKTKTILLALASVAVPLCTNAQLITDMTTGHAVNRNDDQVELQLPQTTNYLRSTTADGHTVYAPQRHVNMQAGQTVNVTFVYDYNANEATPMSLTVYNSQQGILAVDKNGKNATFTAQVPVGTYDMHAMFKGKPTGTYAVFKENVIIGQDTTLTFSKAEATVPFMFKVYDENGTQLTLDKYSGGTVVENGNTNSYRSYSFFALKGMGVVHTIIGGSYRVKGYDVDYYVNKVSDRFDLLHTCNMRSTLNNRTYFFKFETPLNAAATLESKPVNLTLYKQKFTPTPAGEKEPASHIYGNRVWCTYGGQVLLSGKAENKNMVLENNENMFYLDLPEPADKGFAVMVNPMMGDTYIEKNKQYKHIVGLPVTGNKPTGMRVIDYGYDILDGFVIPVGGGAATVYPGHPALSWKDNGENYTYGNSCPIVSVKSKDYDGKSTKLLTYLGRYGEIYETDGTTVVKSQETNGDFIDHTFTQENIKVDDMNGKNITMLHHKSSGDDMTAPSIQMLRFVQLPESGDNDNRLISDRITGNGALEFVAGDMQYHHDKTNASMRYYECKPVSKVEVAYAKHGTDTWNELQAIEVPEYYFMPGFGHFYKASLSTVASDGEWFDLKIKLTDASGNTQTQTLMPAVFIKNGNAGIGFTQVNREGIICYKNGIIGTECPAQIVICTIDGKIAKRTYGTNLETSALAKGVYVVKAIVANGESATLKIVL